MIHLKSFAIAALSTSLALCAYAEDTHYSGFFLGASGGYNDPTLPSGTFTVNGGGSTSTVTASEKKWMGEIHGGYLFDLGSGFDLGPMISLAYYSPYTLKSTTSSSEEKVSVYGLDFAIAGQYTWQSFFTRVHLGEDSIWTSGNQSSGNSGNLSDNQHAFKILAGGSIGYYFTKELNMAIFYQHLFGSTVGDSQTIPSINSVGLSIEYAFGKPSDYYFGDDESL